jgi:putative ABC transport system permease protein
VLQPVGGSSRIRYNLGRILEGTHDYQVAVGCPDGCRIASLWFTPVRSFEQIYQGFEPTTLRLTGLRQTGPDASLATGAQMREWRDLSQGRLNVDPADDGITVTVATTSGGGSQIGAPDVPLSMAAVGPETVDVLRIRYDDGTSVPATGVAHVPMLPRLGKLGALVDLAELARGGDVSLYGGQAEVWLGPEAPADARARLEAAGLTVTGERSLDTDLTAAQARPTAIGLRFLLAMALLGLVLGAGGLAVVAGIERRQRAEELGALRRQGLSRGVAAGIGLLGYLAVAGVGAVCGGLLGVGVWLVTSAYLPIIEQGGPPVAVPRLPGLSAVGAWVAASAVLIAVAALLAAALTRAVHGASVRNGRNGG